MFGVGRGGGVGQLVRLGANTLGFRRAIRQAVAEARTELHSLTTAMPTNVGGAQVRAIQRDLKAAGSAGVVGVQQMNRELDVAKKKADLLGTALKFAVLGVAGGLALVLGSGVKAAISFEGAMAGVSRTTGLVGKDLDALGQQFRDMAKTMPLGVDQIAKLGEAAGALGIASGDITKFVKVATMIGTTTEVSADQAATALGQLSNTLHMTGADYEHFAASMVDLSNNGASTATSILGVTKRVAAASYLIGLTTQQTLGWSAAIANLGGNVEAGGSALQRFFLNVNKFAGADQILTQTAKAGGLTAAQLEKLAGSTDKVGKAALKAFMQGTGLAKKDLTTEITNKKGLDLLTQLAGFRASPDFVKLYNADANEAIRRVVTGLSQLDKVGRTKALGDLGLKSVQLTTAMLGLAGNIDMVNKSLGVSESAWKANTAAQSAFDKRNETTQSNLTRMMNNLHDVFISVGQNLLPPLAAALAFVTDNIIPAFKALGEIWTNILQKPFQKLGDAVGSLFAQLGHILFDWGGNGKGDGVRGTFDTIAKVVASFASGLADAVKLLDMLTRIPGMDMLLKTLMLMAGAAVGLRAIRGFAGIFGGAGRAAGNLLGGLPGLGGMRSSAPLDPAAQAQRAAADTQTKAAEMQLRAAELQQGGVLGPRGAMATAQGGVPAGWLTGAGGWRKGGTAMANAPALLADAEVAKLMADMESTIRRRVRGEMTSRSLGVISEGSQYAGQALVPGSPAFMRELNNRVDQRMRINLSGPGQAGGTVFGATGKLMAVGTDAASRAAYAADFRRMEAAGQGFMRNAGAVVANGVEKAAAAGAGIRSAIGGKLSGLGAKLGSLFMGAMVADIVGSLAQEPVANIFEAKGYHQLAEAWHRSWIEGIQGMVRTIFAGTDAAVGRPEQFLIGGRRLSTSSLVGEGRGGFQVSAAALNLMQNNAEGSFQNLRGQKFATDEMKDQIKNIATWIGSGGPGKLSPEKLAQLVGMAPGLGVDVVRGAPGMSRGGPTLGAVDATATIAKFMAAADAIDKMTQLQLRTWMQTNGDKVGMGLSGRQYQMLTPSQIEHLGRVLDSVQSGEAPAWMARFAASQEAGVAPKMQTAADYLKGTATADATAQHEAAMTALSANVAEAGKQLDAFSTWAADQAKTVPGEIGSRWMALFGAGVEQAAAGGGAAQKRDLIAKVLFGGDVTQLDGKTKADIDALWQEVLTQFSDSSKASGMDQRKEMSKQVLALVEGALKDGVPLDEIRAKLGAKWSFLFDGLGNREHEMQAALTQSISKVIFEGVKAVDTKRAEQDIVEKYNKLVPKESQLHGDPTRSFHTLMRRIMSSYVDEINAADTAEAQAALLKKINDTLPVSEQFKSMGDLVKSVAGQWTAKITAAGNDPVQQKKVLAAFNATLPTNEQIKDFPALAKLAKANPVVATALAGMLTDSAAGIDPKPMATKIGEATISAVDQANKATVIDPAPWIAKGLQIVDYVAQGIAQATSLRRAAQDQLNQLLTMLPGSPVKAGPLKHPRLLEAGKGIVAQLRQGIRAAGGLTVPPLSVGARFAAYGGAAPGAVPFAMPPMPRMPSAAMQGGSVAAQRAFAVIPPAPGGGGDGGPASVSTQQHIYVDRMYLQSEADQSSVMKQLSFMTRGGR